MLARVAQLADIFADARLMMDSGNFHLAILGDMNTMAHGIARLSPNYCCDRMRFLTVGRDEGVMWERAVLAQHDPRYDPTRDQDRTASNSTRTTAVLDSTSQPIETNARVPTNSGLSGSPNAEAKFESNSLRAQQLPLVTTPTGNHGNTEEDIHNQHQLPLSVPINRALLRWGLPPEFAQDAVNPGFACPFVASETVTLDNPAYRWFGLSLMKGKLDWVLLRRVKWMKKEVGNLKFELSDHRWLLVEAMLESNNGK